MTLDARSIALLVLALVLAGCAGLTSNLGDLLAGVVNPGKAVPGNFWELSDSVVCGPAQAFVDAAAPEPTPDAASEPLCVLEVATQFSGCLDQQPARIPVFFPVKASGVSRQVLLNLCQQAPPGGVFPHLDGHFDSAGRRVVDDANRGISD